MTFEKKVFIGSMVLAVLVVLFLIARFLPRKLSKVGFVRKWRDVQLLCKDKKTWPIALVQADNLLDLALRRKKIKGKTMGERLVSLGGKFSDNDALWSAHNLSKKVLDQPNVKLKDNDMKNALIAFRQALRDIGALPPSPEDNQEPKM